MRINRIPRSIARFIERNPWWMILAAVILTAATVPGILLLKTETGTDTLVSRNSDVFQDTIRYEEQFGSEPIVVMLSGDLADILSTENLAVLQEFEDDFTKDERYRDILGPLTIIRTAINKASQAEQALQENIEQAMEVATQQALQATRDLDPAQQAEAVEQAKAQVLQNFQPYLEEMQQIGEPSLDNPQFVKKVIYDKSGSISSEMKSFIPDEQHVIMTVTLLEGMDNDESLQALRDVESFFSSHPMDGVGVKVVGSVEVIDAIARGIGGSMKVLLAMSIVAMGIILLVTFRVRWNLLSLFMVGVGALWTFGIMGYLGVPLSMTTMAVLPILIGLGIDYSIQFHNRYQEEVTRNKSVALAIIVSISRMFPAVSIALLSTIIGFITLYLSDVPMVRDFGLMLAVGVFLSCVVALFLLHSILYVDERRMPIDKLGRASAAATHRIERVLSRLAKIAIRHPIPILLVAAIWGIAGGVADHWLPSVSDYEDLMPQDNPTLIEVREVREITGHSANLRFIIEANDVTDQQFLIWLQGYQQDALDNYPALISADSPAIIVSEASGGSIPDQTQIDQILADTPSVYVDRTISKDRKMASLSFTIEYLPMEEVHSLQSDLINDARPPEGVQIAPVGVMALGASIIDAMLGSRLTMNLLCLGAIALAMLIIYRRLTSVIFTVIPVGAVIAWASLDLYLFGIPLNPLTAVLGVIIIGIGTEFMVLIISRYNEEKRRGQPPREAMVISLSKIGRAIITTALTTVGGFAILIASNFVLIRDFGIATTMGVLLCLLSSVVVMPPLIVWWDERVAGKESLRRL